MNNDFKRSSYFITIILFFLGIMALVGVSAAKYFAFDETVVTVSQIICLVSFFALFINCIYAKSKYNSACIKFADYIITNRRKEADRRAADNERMKEMQNIRAAAEHDKEKAVAAALQQGRSEGLQSAGTFITPDRNIPAPVQPKNVSVPQQPVAAPQSTPAMPGPSQSQQPAPVQQPMPTPQQPIPVQQPMPMTMPQQSAPVQPRTSVPRQAVPDEQITMPNEEVLFNEYGEPVMIRRRVRKTAFSPDGEMLYDSQGNPVIRRNQGLWEPLEQRHEIIVKVETSPGVTVSTPSSHSDSQ